MPKYIILPVAQHWLSPLTTVLCCNIKRKLRGNVSNVFFISVLMVFAAIY